MVVEKIIKYRNYRCGGINLWKYKYGEYIKDVFGRIGKVQLYRNGTYFTKKFGASSGEILKHAKDIIDLIEVGDYVNGSLVTNVDKVDNMNFIEWDNGEMYKTEIQNDKFIKSIVTHQQFKRVEYEV